jgi:hypothetical protein
MYNPDERVRSHLIPVEWIYRHRLIAMFPAFIDLRYANPVMLRALADFGRNWYSKAHSAEYSTSDYTAPSSGFPLDRYRPFGSDARTRFQPFESQCYHAVEHNL